MENRIITISREVGSGGRTIGRKLAERLGIQCYDAELIQRIVEKSGYPADFVKRSRARSLRNWRIRSHA